SRGRAVRRPIRYRAPSHPVRAPMPRAPHAAARRRRASCTSLRSAAKPPRRTGACRSSRDPLNLARRSQRHAGAGCAGVAQYARQEMARHTVGPRRTDSLRTYVRATRIIGGLSVVVLCGAIAWDLANDGFWSRHALFTGLVASLIVVAVTAAVLN